MRAIGHPPDEAGPAPRADAPRRPSWAEQAEPECPAGAVHLATSSLAQPGRWTKLRAPGATTTISVVPHDQQAGPGTTTPAGTASCSWTPATGAHTRGTVGGSWKSVQRGTRHFSPRVQISRKAAKAGLPQTCRPRGWSQRRHLSWTLHLRHRPFGGHFGQRGQGVECADIVGVAAPSEAAMEAAEGEAVDDGAGGVLFGVAGGPADLSGSAGKQGQAPRMAVMLGSEPKVQPEAKAKCSS